MSSNIVLLIQNNEVIGHSTDTVFGLISKLDKNNIRKINELKGRDPDQPLQILINSIDELEEIIEPNEFVNDYIKNKLEKRTSYIVKAKKEFADNYLNEKFNNTIMFRIPEGSIKEILKEEKILFATSANKHGESPVLSIEEFNNKFPNLKAFGNDEVGKASKIISLINNEEEIKRN